jgi:hypothetical protein
MVYQIKAMSLNMIRLDVNGPRSNESNNMDNVQWIVDHKAGIVPDDPDKTLIYVLNNHPNKGCYESKMPILKRTETIEELAKMADAVTIGCLDTVGYRTQFRVTKLQLRTFTSTAIANTAYVALKHKNRKIRKEAMACLDKWRQLK